MKPITNHVRVRLRQIVCGVLLSTVGVRFPLLRKDLPAGKTPPSRFVPYSHYERRPLPVQCIDP